MKILHVIKALNLAGASRSLCAIARQLPAFGSYEHSLISLTPMARASRELAREANITVFDVPDQRTTRRLLEEADIVHLEWWNNPSIGRFLRSELPAIRLLLFVHVAGDTVPHVLTPSIVNFADYCATGCPYAWEREAIQQLPADVRRAKIGVVLATFDFDRLSGFTPQPHDTFNVGYIGTADFKKMHPHFVRMNASVNVPGAKFVVCGRGPLEVLRHQSQELAAADRFDFRGYVFDIRSVLEILDVYGYPLGDNPGAELNVQEAMYVGIPPVVFPVGGLRDIVIHQQTGLAVHTEEEYRDAIEFLYHHPEERKRLGRNAASYARQHFGGANSARQLHAIYEQMMAMPKRRRHWNRPFNLPGIPEDNGARLFVESLGTEGAPFWTSLAGINVDEALAAEAQISNALPRAVTGIEEYQQYYRYDGHLHLWMGLTFWGSDQPRKALAAFEEAARHGLTHWRGVWYQARALDQLGRPVEAAEACRKVLKAAPNFTPARELFQRVAARPSATLSTTFPAAITTPVISSAGINPILEKLGFCAADRVVIIHVDDVAMCQATLTAFMDIVDFGLVSSGSVMVPSPWFPAFVNWRHDHPEADTGIHLTLTSEWDDYRWRPVSTRNLASGLIDKQGFLRHTVRSLAKMASPRAVRVEMEAQVAAVERAGIEFTHLDAHMYAATDTRFLADYLRLGLRKRVPVFIKPELKNRDAESRKLLEEAESKGLPAFDHLVKMFVRGAASEWLPQAKRILEGIEPGLTCLLTHPARETEELKAIVPNWQSRVADYCLLTNPEFARHVADRGIQLITYASLRRAAFPAEITSTPAQA